MSPDQKRQIETIRRAAAALGLVEGKEINFQKLYSRSKITVSLLRKYVNTNEKHWVRVGGRNAPRLARALQISLEDLLA